MRKRFLGLLGALCALMLAVGLLPVRALAANGAASYLALGDSVTSGYGLAEGERAFPDLVAQELGVDYVNAGQPGLTSAELLAQVQDPEMADALSDADIITITIGGNDLMNALYAYLADVINNDPQLSAELGGAMTPEFVQSRLFDENGMTNRPLIDRLLPFIEEFPDSPVFGEALDAFAANLTRIVETINGLNPDVVLVVANQYNPYGHLQDEDLQPLADVFERCALAACDAVGVVTAERASFADLFPAFKSADENPCNAAVVDDLMVSLDFHPNAYGHELIAQAVVDCAPEHPGLTEDWAAVVEELEALEAGAQTTVSIEGNTVVPAAVFKAIAGRDVTVRFELSYDVAWLVNGVDIPTDAALAELNLHIWFNAGDVPESAAMLVIGYYGFMEVAPVFEGDFGFPMTLEILLEGLEDIGIEDPTSAYANVYRYDKATGGLTYEGATRLSEDGLITVSFDHGGPYIYSVDTKSHELPFPDALEGEWYSESVRWVSRNGYMTGYPDGTFGVGNEILRSEAASVFYKMSGLPPVEVGDLPADVEGDAWYTNAVAWALQRGVFNGYGDGSFAPNGTFSREMAACVLFNIAEANGQDVSARGDLSAFGDGAAVSDWATNAVSWAVATGVFHGTDEGNLEPLRNITREEFAAILRNLAAA